MYLIDQLTLKLYKNIYIAIYLFKNYKKMLFELEKNMNKSGTANEALNVKNLKFKIFYWT